MRRFNTARMSLAGALLMMVAPASATTIYRVTDLGALSGGESHGAAINNAGQTVGSSLVLGGASRAFLQSGGLPVDLGAPLGGIESRADGLNNTGLIAGTTYTGTGARATLWTLGVASDLGTLGGSDAWALSVNDAGQVVGGAATAAGRLHAFLSSNGTMADIGALPGGTWSSAYGINASGTIAGTSETAAGSLHAFVWSDGRGLADLGTLGGRYSYGAALNAAGQVVGHAQVGSGYFHAFIWDPKTGMRDLGTLGGMSSFAYSINDSGCIVGTSWVNGSEDTHAFLYQGGVMLDLNNLLDNPAGWLLTDAAGLNASGQIVGTGLRNGVVRAFRLDPIAEDNPALPSCQDALPVVPNPEPSTWLMLIAGMSVLGGYRSYKKRYPAVAGPSRR